jgi:signal transduction histidine kinase
MNGDSLPLALIGILMALWLIGAIVAIWTGLSLRRQSLKILRQTSRLARLLETAPALPVVVKGDGRIEAADRFSRIMGLPVFAASLTDLAGHPDGGISTSDLALLEAKVRETQRTGKSFELPLAVAGSERRLLVMGTIADAVVYPNGAALLWFFDSTQSLRQLEKKTEESQEARAAFAALAGLIEAAPIPMWHRSPDMKLNFVNKAYVDAVNAGDELDVVENGVELLEDEGATTPADFAAAAFNSGELQERFVSATLDGERRQIRVFDIPLGDTGVAGLAIDVQDLNQARADFRRLSEAQRDLLNMMSAGVAQFDANHILAFANLPFQRLFAFRDQWLSDKPEFARVLDRMRENGKLPEVRDFPVWREERETWFRITEPVEENWLLPDGTHLRILAQPVPDGGLLMVFEDRTEQAQLASAHDILLRVRTATFDNLFEAIAVFSGDGRLNIWNRLFAETWGLQDNALIKHPRVDELLPLMAQHLKKPSQISIIGELVRMTSANRQQRKNTASFADGRMFQIATIPLPDGNALFTMLDMSDSMKIEQALRDRNAALQEADSIKAKFLSNMSYEFRTPLTSISGFADLLKSGMAGDLSDQANEYLDAITVSADRLSEQINMVLDYSQSEAGALPLAKESVSIKKMLEDLIKQKSELAFEYSVFLDLQVEDADVTANADPQRLVQAIGQLLDNAIRHNRQKGKVLLLARRANSHVEIIVSDNGPGISSQTKESLVGKASANPFQEAQGIGLAFARQLIESHEGTFRIESDPGQGTTITIAISSQ